MVFTVISAGLTLVLAVLLARQYASRLKPVVIVSKPRQLKTLKGAEMIEYGAMAAGIVLIIVAVIALIGPKINELFTNIMNNANNAGGGTGAP